VMKEKISHLQFKSYPWRGHDVHQEKADEILSAMLKN
jgi:hypothetical protein